MEETWQQFNNPDLRATLPLYLEVLAAACSTPSGTGPSCATC
ncbi:hypothetical protein ACFQ51_50415 [Streptomyces kaempferi]